MTDDYAVPEWGTFQVRKLNEDNEKDKKKIKVFSQPAIFVATNLSVVT
jgi:hypothetical protein